MAIAFDTAASATSSTSATTLTFSHTISGSDCVILVGVCDFNHDGADSVTGVTYNGVALTKAVEGPNPGGNAYCSLWYLAAASTGTHSIVVTRTSTSSSMVAASVSYTGVAQTSPVEATGSNDGNSSPVTASVTTQTANAWVVGFFGSQGNIVASTGLTSRANPTQSIMGDSDGPISSAGSCSMSVTFSSGTPATTGVLAAIKPAAIGGGAIKHSS